MPYPGFPTFPKYPSARPGNLDEAIMQGQGTKILPTTDTGYREYGNGGRLFLPASTNYCTNPSFEVDTNADGLSDSTTIVEGVSGSPACTRVTGRTGGNAQRVQYTGAAGDAGTANEHVSLETNMSSAGSFVQNDNGTFSVWAKGNLVGCSAYLRIQFLTDAGAWVEQSNTPISITSEWTRFSTSKTAAGATCGRAKGTIVVHSIGEGDTLDVTMDDMLLEESPTITPYFDGSYPDCAWTGTANASTSTRTASTLKYALPSSWNNPLIAATRAVVATPAFSSSQMGGSQAGIVSLAGYNDGDVLWNYRVSGSPGTYTDGTAWSSGKRLTLVSRGVYGGTWTRLLAADTVVTGSSIGTSPASQTEIRVGIADWWSNIIIGPVLISPYRKSDAWTTAIQANSGAAYNDLMGLWEYFMEPGDLLIPLKNNSNAYLKTKGAKRSIYDYVYTGTDATTDTGWESYS